MAAGLTDRPSLCPSQRDQLPFKGRRAERSIPSSLLMLWRCSSARRACWAEATGPTN
jgi:hypothetical protein